MGNQYPMRKLTVTFPGIHLRSWFPSFKPIFRLLTRIIIIRFNDILGLLSRWAAYVAGTILVLMRELKVRFEDSISILVTNLY